MSEDTRDRLIDSAYQLIVLKGFGSTRVDEICQAAKASKGSFYHLFKSKEAIGLAVFERYYESVWARLISGPFVTDTNPGRRLKGFLNHCKALIPELLKGGSLLTTLAVELPVYSDEFSSRVRERTDLLAESLAETFDGLDLPGDVRSTKELSYIYLAMIEGAVTLKGLTDSHSLVDQTLGAFRSFVLDEET
jgi:TetR/AcrR family transcriptional repressor of nem operon